MLKTTADNPARFGTLSKGLISYAVLTEYVHHPLTFLIGTALTLPGFKKTIPTDVPREFVELFAFPAWIYIRLKQRLEPDKALALARAIILPLGMAAYGAEFGVVEAPHTWTNFTKYLDRGFKQGAIRWSNVEGEERTDTTLTYRCVSCMIHAFLSEVGIPELTESFCSLDNSLYNSYMPNEMTFDRGGPANTIAKGNPFCQFNHAVQMAS